MLEVLGVDRCGKRSASDFRSFFRISGEDKVECRFTDAGSELGAGNALAPHCKETGFSSPAFTPRPSFCSTPHCFVFFPPLVRRGPAQPCIKKPQIAVVLGYWSQKWFWFWVWSVGPIPTPDGGLGASSSVGRGMCVVDGSIHYVGCRRF